ncbi:hypothetical protein GGX14DRAFT_577612 [Mycena pura]|uniref:Uncharacterized protein n=1 Tax=Mycena pura TaxID=153505 RepID=A0AAD6Y3V8_9AGAR|nr:hypothetical protein GGX14DRAFT_577612 [Mycena pura]
MPSGSFLPSWTRAPYLPPSPAYDKLPSSESDAQLLPSESFVDSRSEKRGSDARGGGWLQPIVLVLASLNVLIALGTLLLTRDLADLHVPASMLDVQALPRPDPYVGLKL